MAEKVEIKFYKIDNITQATTKNSLFAVKADNENSFKLYVTDLDGNLIPLFTSSGTGSGITNLTSTDSSILITGSSTRDLKLSTTLKNLINSALQSNDPISSLLNDAGYLTLADLPTFNPSDYDLEDFTNTSTDPFVKQSEISSGETNLTYTASPTNGTVVSDTGSDATIPLADNTNAGLIDSAEKSKIATAIQPSDLGVVATSNDYNDLDNIPTTFTPSAHTHVEADITDLDKYTQLEVDNFLDDKVDKVAGKSLIDDTEITRLSSVTNFDNSGNITALANKVDKIIGKGLSTEDYTTVEKSKLSGIESGAEVNVNADWNATSGDAQILNKPTIPSIVGLATETYVDAKVEDTIVDGVTTKAPSQNAVFDALALKANTSNVVLLTGNQTIAGTKTFSSEIIVNNGIRIGLGNAGGTNLVVGNAFGSGLNAASSGNIAIGSNALSNVGPIIAVSNNIAIGNLALNVGSQMTNNVAIGTGALRRIAFSTHSNNVAVGFSSGELTNTGGLANAINQCTLIGSQTTTLNASDTNSIVIGFQGRGNGSNTVTLGNTSITDTFLRGRVRIPQYTTATRPVYTKGAVIFDTTLNKLVVGGATAWEVITST